jgi:hypothetical protein
MFLCLLQSFVEPRQAFYALLQYIWAYQLENLNRLEYYMSPSKLLNRKKVLSLPSFHFFLLPLRQVTLSEV